MKEQDNYKENITNQGNIFSNSMANDNNENKLSNDNIQLNNFNQINQNINNMVSLNQIPNLNTFQNQISLDTNLELNSKTQNISDFQLIEDLNNNKDILNNNIYNQKNQNNNLYNFNNNIYNNLNNFNIGGSNNKKTKPFFTSKHDLLNSHSLDKINQYIQKDFSQLEKFLPNYKIYISNNNFESINICLKYIEYTNFFFNKIITNKVNDMLKKIMHSNNYYNNNYNNQNFEFYNIKKKIKDLFNKLIPFEMRINYLNIFYEKNNEKKLYNLFQNDLNKYQRQIDKIIYLSEIFEIVKQKMDSIDKEDIKNYFKKISAYHNSKNQNMNNNIYLLGNNGTNSDKNGGNYSNHNNFHNNSRQYRKYSYQSPNAQNRTNNSNNYYENNNFNNNNGNNYYHSTYNNKNNNYNNLNEDGDNLGYNNNYNNSNHHHNSAFQRNNNYKGSFSSSRHYYNNNKNINLRNKGNRKNSAYSGVLVEIDSSPKKQENNENPEIINKEEKKEDEKNIINNNEEDIKNGNEKDSNKTNEDNNINNEEVKNNSGIINNEEIDIENNLNINNENNKKEIFLKEDEQMSKNDDNSDSKDENLIQDFNSINPFHETVTSSEENSIKEDSNNQLLLNNPKSDNNIININIDNNIENKNIINNLGNTINNPDYQQEGNSLILNIINNNQNNMINSALYQNENIDNDPQNNLYDYCLEQIEEKDNQNNEIKEEEIINNINIIDNKNLEDNKSRDHSPKNISLSDSNIPKINQKLDNTKLDRQDKIGIQQNKNLKNQNNNNILFNNNISNNNITNEQLQLFNMMMLQNNNLLMNMNHFHNQINPKINNNNLNNIQINNNINNINNNFNNLNLINNNLNTNMNLLNNNYYYSNNSQINNTIFSNYMNDNGGLLSNLKKIFPNNISNNINYINSQNEQLSIEYNQIKKELPEMLGDFSNLFEEKIIFPVYAKINEEIQNKREFYTEIYNKYKDIIIKILSKYNFHDSRVEPFGSIVNNFMTELGDIDICIIPKDNTLIQGFWELLEEIKEEVINNQKIAEFILIERYPRFLLLKLKDIETNIDLDITVQNTLPILNTKLIRVYSLLDQRFHILGIFLKFWVKKNKIHSALDKYLSSYALLILIIHYLQSIVEPKILPILQQVQNIQEEYIYYYEEKKLKTNLYFEEDLNKIENYMNIINDKNVNTSSVVELLIGFFDYYAYKYNHYLISISRSDKKPVPEEETIAFPLEDPFDVNYNPGKSMKRNTLQFAAFMYCMKKELNNILSGEYFKMGLEND